MEELREKIDQIDARIVESFTQRMQLSQEIAGYKKENNLPIADPKREREKLDHLGKLVPDDLRQSVYSLYDLLFDLSKAHQRDLNRQQSPLYKEIEAALEETPKLFPKEASVACQGAEGAYGQIAAQRIFQRPSLMHFKSFESVCSAVESGLCEYGVLPLENSTAGSVREVYDLMLRHKFHIVKSLRLKVDHAFLTKSGVKKSAIREVYSHPQAIAQCAEFLEKLGADVKITPCENTAVAAQMVAESGRTDVAAISSSTCAALFGLDIADEGIQDSSSNYTRFICIAKRLEIYPGADRSSVLLVLPHKPGALYKVLARFYALGMNLAKLESRPLPGKDFEFMFYFDLETSVYSPEFAQVIDELQETCPMFYYLGSYSEGM